jgi:hypothetical protein
MSDRKDNWIKPPMKKGIFHLPKGNAPVHPYMGLMATAAPRDAEGFEGMIVDVSSYGMVTFLLNDGTHRLASMQVITMDDPSLAAERMSKSYQSNS